MIHDKDLFNVNEYLFEETRKSLFSSTWSSIKARVRNQNITAKYLGVSPDGDITFRVTSGTTPGKFWYVQIRFKDLKKAKDLIALHPLTRKETIIKMLIDGDLFLYCSCPMFAFYCKYVAWKSGYGISRETRPAKIRNPRNEKIVCKHCIAALLLMADSSDRIYSDLYKAKVLRKASYRPPKWLRH